jgi:hypothetical protein
MLARSVRPSVSGCRQEDMLSRVPRRLQSACQKALNSFGSRCNLYTPYKTNLQFFPVVTAYVHGTKWVIRVILSATISTRSVKTIAHWQVCPLVKTKCVPRSGWNMQGVKSHSHMRLDLDADASRRSAHRNLSYLGEFVSTRTCRALWQECMQLLCDPVTECY